MGQALIKGYKPGQNFPQLLDETQIFATWSVADVRELWQRFQRSVYGFALVEAQFESILAFKERSVRDHVDLEVLFEVLDNDHDGRIDGLEFLGGLALCCQVCVCALSLFPSLCVCSSVSVLVSVTISLRRTHTNPLSPSLPLLTL